MLYVKNRVLRTVPFLYSVPFIGFVEIVGKKVG